MNDAEMESRRIYLTNCFQTALRQVNVSEYMRRHVLCSPTALSISGREYRLSDFSDFVIIAIGKAAGPMFDSLADVLAPRLEPDQRLRGVAVTTTEPRSVYKERIEIHAGSHPEATPQSLTAADAVISHLSQSHAESLILFLISGGASAMMEKPLTPRLSMEDLIQFHRAVVHSGLPITETNALRKHLSAVKGGRLLDHVGDATSCTLLVSDVPTDALDVIGSGPTLPDRSTIADCRELLSSASLRESLPSAIVEYLEGPDALETPKPSDPIFRRTTWFALLSNDDLVREIAQTLSPQYQVVIDNATDDWDFNAAADALLARVKQLAQTHSRFCVVSGGEVTVSVSEAHGRGGRNQQFALAVAASLAREPMPVTVLSGGSDGIDGNSPAAGAVVDSTTAARARSAGFSVEQALAEFNVFPLLHSLGDTIVTGPTGNNLRDVRIFLYDRGDGAANHASAD